MRGAFLIIVMALLASPASTSEPSLFTANQQSHDLAGSIWIGDDGPIGRVRFKFERSGVLEYSYRGRTYRNGTWKQSGNRLYFEMNQGFRECKAVVLGSTIRGESRNKGGEKWTTTIRPENKSK